MCRIRQLRDARVAKLVDARDLKSLGGNPMPVRLRPRAPDASSFVFADSYLVATIRVIAERCPACVHRDHVAGYARFWRRRTRGLATQRRVQPGDRIDGDDADESGSRPVRRAASFCTWTASVAGMALTVDLNAESSGAMRVAPRLRGSLVVQSPWPAPALRSPARWPSLLARPMPGRLRRPPRAWRCATPRRRRPRPACPGVRSLSGAGSKARRARRRALGLVARLRSGGFGVELSRPPDARRPTGLSPVRTVRPIPVQLSRRGRASSGVGTAWYCSRGISRTRPTASSAIEAAAASGMNRVQRDLLRCVAATRQGAELAIASRAAARIRASVELEGSSRD